MLLRIYKYTYAIVLKWYIIFFNDFDSTEIPQTCAIVTLHGRNSDYNFMFEDVTYSLRFSKKKKKYSNEIKPQLRGD